MPDINNLIEERFILAHGFRGFSHGQLSPFLLSLWQGRNITMEGHGGEKLLISGQPGSRERVRDWGKDRSSKGMSLVTYFLQLGLTSC
jgi:hypothetical protein